MKELLQHAAWADALLWASVLRTPQLAGDERARELLHHVHAVQWVYLRLTRGEPPDIPELDAFDGLETIRDWGRRGHEEAAAHFASLDDASLDAPLVLPWADSLVERYGKAQPTTVRDGVVQVATHTTYHRGQLAARVREAGGEPPLSDYIVWVWAGRPEAEWSGG